METATGVRVVTAMEGKEGFLGSIGVRFLIEGSEAGERFSLVEHPMSARALAARPSHHPAARKRRTMQVKPPSTADIARFYATVSTSL